MSRVFALPNTNNKAIVIIKDGKEVLQSYDTEVAELDIINNKMTVNGIYSITTLMHIKLFLEQHGYPKMTKQEIIKKFNVKESY